MKFTILIIDDEKNIREGLGAALEMEGYATRLAANGRDGLAEVARGDIDLVVTDLRMDGVSGEEVLREVAKKYPAIPVIVLTGHGSIDAAVSAMRSGAYDFLTKPLNLDEFSLIIKRALQNRELSLEHKELKERLYSNETLSSIIGQSVQMQKVLQLVKKVAPSKASVLITGESGVGKEVVANAIHALSPRRERACVKVHCAALSETLLESELFGHEKGAFTGAENLAKGRFELAHNSTIFLDEIGEINQATQIKLLRVLQEKKFERVGGQETIDVDVRVIAATNRDLEEEVRRGNFREDLYFRLNVIRINIPPLRERKDDIPLLINHFLKEFEGEARDLGKTILGIESRARSVLYKYDWPGNIRELRNAIESAVVMCQKNEITLEDLPPSVSKKSGSQSVSIPVGSTLEEAEKIVIRDTLAFAKGNKSRAAEILGIGRKTLQRKLGADDGE